MDIFLCFRTIQKGKRKAIKETFEELNEKWAPLINKLSTQYVIPGWDKEDTMQELRIALLRASQLYDSSKGAKFGTYLHNALKNRVHRIYADTKWKKHIPEDMIIRMDDINSHPMINDLEETDIISGLQGEAKRISEYILAGFEKPSDWKKKGMTDKEIEMGVNNLKVVLKGNK